MEDRISSFPDEVLGHILSFLNTKQAVATSILSKRWEFLWTYVDTLEIEFKKPGSKLQFEQHVNRALDLHRGFIKKLRLYCFDRVCNKDDIVKWIQTAISKKAETLHLCFRNNNPKWHPSYIFHIETLVELKLEYADFTYIDIPTEPFFPNLKTLDLYRPYCENDFLNRFISGCSILENFSLHLDYYREAWRISSATLKTVRICFCDLYSGNELVLNTPALEFLRIWKTADLKLLVESSMESLHKAVISIHLSELDDNFNSDSSLKYLEFLSNVSALTCYVQNFDSRTMNKLNFHAHFNNLTRLEIIDSQFGLDLLRIFIETSNNLEVITLRRLIGKKYWGVIWEEPQQVPMCLLSSLQRVSIHGYNNKEEEEVESMIKYILGNAKVLKRMELSEADFVKVNNEFKLHMVQKISMFPRASIECEISFD